MTHDETVNHLKELQRMILANFTEAFFPFVEALDNAIILLEPRQVDYSNHPKIVGYIPREE